MDNKDVIPSLVVPARQVLWLATVVKHVAVIDNYDSFVYILVQYLYELGAEVTVLRNDVPITEVENLNPDKILISPGPGTPADAGISNNVLETFAETKPIFGVCLGHQCIAEHFGATVVRAQEIMHGKTSMVDHNGTGVFKDLPNELTATRYHSLTVDETTIPDTLEVTAKSESGLIMGLRHKALDIEGVQFHPESVLTQYGHNMIANFLSR